MNSRPITPSSKSFQYQPNSQWFQDQENHILEVELPEFKKEELRVQIDTLGTLRIIGQRETGRVKPFGLRQTFRIPYNSKCDEIKAKFENGVLKVFIPFRNLPKPTDRLGMKVPETTSTSSDHKQAAADEKQPLRQTETGGKQPLQHAEMGSSSRRAGESIRATESLNRPLVTTKNESRGDAKYMNRIGITLKDKRKRVASVGIGILTVAVVLGLFLTYRHFRRWVVERN